MSQYELTGKVDVSMNGVTIPAMYISDEGVTTTFTEMVREIPTMDGMVRQPTGTFEEAMASVVFVLPNMNYAKNIFPDLYTASSDRPSVAGHTVFGGEDCTVRVTTPVVVHYTCQENSDNDVFIPEGLVVANVELVQNLSDPVTITVTVEAQPNSNEDYPLGMRGWIGTGSLDEPTVWNPATEEYEPLGSS